jgi:hypothetical protein
MRQVSGRTEDDDGTGPGGSATDQAFAQRIGLQGSSHDQIPNALGLRGYDIRSGGMTTAVLPDSTNNPKSRLKVPVYSAAVGESAVGNQPRYPVKGKLVLIPDSWEKKMFKKLSDFFWTETFPIRYTKTCLLNHNPPNQGVENKNAFSG